MTTPAIRRLALSGLMAIGAMTLVSCTSVPPAFAQSQDNIPVLVMGEDSDPRSVSRRSDIFKRVLRELKESMLRHGFRMRDEEMVAVDLGWRITDRRPKVELVEAAKLMNQSDNAAHHVRAMAVFSIHAFKKDLGFAEKAEVRIDGEIYDTQNNRFIGSFEIPRQTFPIPADCNGGCISEHVGDRAKDIAISIGDVLGRKLAYLSPAERGPSGIYTGMKNTYTVRFNRFASQEALSVIGVMAEEFPGYVSHDLHRKQARLRVYDYVTTASPAKMEEWLTILLSDMGLRPDHDVELMIQGNTILMERVLPRAENAPVTGGRFQ